MSQQVKLSDFEEHEFKEIIASSSGDGDNKWKRLYLNCKIANGKIEFQIKTKGKTEGVAEHPSLSHAIERYNNL